MEKLTEQAEDILESLWVMTVEGDNVGCLLTSLKITVDAPELSELLQLAYVELRGDRVNVSGQAVTVFKGELYDE